MNPSFASGHVKNLSTIIIEECITFRSTLKKLAQAGKPIDMEAKGAELIFDVIARIVYNQPLSAQTSGSQTLLDLQQLVHLAEAGLSMNPVVKVQAWWKRKVVRERVDRAVKKKIHERYELLRSEGVVLSRKDPSSTLDLMLREQLMNAEGKGVKEIDAEFEKLLVTNVKGLLLGGHGATSDTLSFCYMLLSKHPDVVQQLREEHAKVFAPDFETTVAQLQENPYKLNELTYTTAVIRETLRLFPVGFGVRIAAPGATITATRDGATCPIDRDLCVIALQHHMHYSPSYFSDPATFNPSRFLDGEITARGTMRAFSRGPRACLGQELAVDELRIILLMTVRDFEFEYAHMEPNREAKVRYTQLDRVFGDVVFQELGMEAKPRGGMIMKVKEVGKSG